MLVYEMRTITSADRFVRPSHWTIALANNLQAFSFSQILMLAYQSVGVIYGDIGTSPLYVYSSTFTEAPNRANLLGALSLIIWSLTLMVTIKYVLVILHADNDGEGGTFSTYSLLSRYVRTSWLITPNVTNCSQANISNRDPREATMIRKLNQHQLLHWY